MAPREYCVWSSAEENALLAGVQRHGLGAWEVIRSDPEFKAVLRERTGVQLKDKWRNLVKFKHIGRVSNDPGQSQGLNFRDRKRRRLSSPDGSQRTGGSRDVRSVSPKQDFTADGSPPAEQSQVVPAATSPAAAVRASGAAALQQQRKKLDEAEQHYAAMLSIALLAQAAVHTESYRKAADTPDSKCSLATGSADTRGIPSSAQGPATPTKDQALSDATAVDSQAAELPHSPQDASVAASLERAVGAGAKHSPQQHQLQQQKMQAGIGDEINEGLSQNFSLQPQRLKPEAGAPAHGSAADAQKPKQDLYPQALKQEVDHHQQSATSDMQEVHQQRTRPYEVQHGPTATHRVSDDHAPVTSGAAMQHDDTAQRAARQQQQLQQQEGISAAAWLAESQSSLHAAEQAVKKASLELQEAARALQAPPARRKQASKPATRRVSQRNQGKNRRSYRDELGSDIEEEMVDEDLDVDDPEDGVVPHEDRRYGIYDTRRYKPPSRGKGSLDGKQGKQGRSPTRVATPDRPDDRTAPRPLETHSSLQARGLLPLIHRERITPKDSQPLDIPDLLHTLLELNHGRPTSARGSQGGDDSEVLRWRGSGFRSLRYQRDHWSSPLFESTRTPPHRPQRPSLQPPPWFKPTQPTYTEGPVHRTQPTSRRARSAERDSLRPRRRAGKPTRLKDMVTDDEAEEANSAEEQSRTDREDSLPRRPWPRHAVPRGDRDKQGVKWGRTRPRRHPSDGSFMDDDDAAEMFFDKDMHEGALALTLAHDSFHADDPHPFDSPGHRPEPGLHELGHHMHQPRPNHLRAGHERGGRDNPGDFLHDMLGGQSHGAAQGHAPHHPASVRMQAPSRGQMPQFPYPTNPSDLVLPRPDPRSALLAHDHPLVDGHSSPLVEGPSSRGNADMGLLGMLGIVHATAAQMRAGNNSRGPANSFEAPTGRSSPRPKLPLLDERRMGYHTPLDEVDLDLVDQHPHLAFNPLRVHGNNNTEPVDSAPSNSSNVSSDVAASESHYMSQHGMQHQHGWPNQPDWAVGLSNAARDASHNRDFACSTPPLLLPGKPATSGNIAAQAASFGAELDEAAAAITSMMHQRQAMGSGYGPAYLHGAPGSHSLAPEHLTDAVVREAGDIGRRPATELMDGGHQPQLHFDLDQMLGVDQENGLPHSGGMDMHDSRMISRGCEAAGHNRHTLSSGQHSRPSP